jgi:hypothetical protein
LSEERTEGIASMGEVPFLFTPDFGEGEAEGGNEEKRVVTKAIGAAGLVEYLAFDDAFGAEEDFAVAGEGEGADETCGAGCVGESGEEGEEAEVVASVFATGGGVEVEVVGEAGGAYAGVATEGVDFEAGIVGEDEAVGGEEGVGAGLDLGIAHEGVGVFDGLGHFVDAGKFSQFAAFGVSGCLELGELSDVGCCGIQSHGAPWQILLDSA